MIINVVEFCVAENITIKFWYDRKYFKKKLKNILNRNTIIQITNLNILWIFYLTNG